MKKTYSIKAILKRNKALIKYLDVISRSKKALTRLKEIEINNN